MTSNAAFMLLAMLAQPSIAQSELPVWHGPALFCGYASHIQLESDETIEPGDVGIHTGNFLWSGPWGSAAVTDIEWASRPISIVRAMGNLGPYTLYRLVPGEHRQIRYALGDEPNHLAAYVGSTQFTGGRHDLDILRRIRLKRPEESDGDGCRYRMMLVVQ